MTNRKFPKKAPLQEIDIVRREAHTEDLFLMWLVLFIISSVVLKLKLNFVSTLSLIL